MKVRIEIEAQTQEEFDHLRFELRNVFREMAAVTYFKDMLGIEIVIPNPRYFSIECGTCSKTIKIYDECIHPDLDKTYITVTFEED